MLPERLVHSPLGVVEDPQRPHLVGEPVGVVRCVAAPHPEQDEHPRADLRHPLALDVDGGLADPLDERSHLRLPRTAAPYREESHRKKIKMDLILI